MSIRRRSPWRPSSAVTTANIAVRKARARAALPRLAVIRGRELRRALGHQGVPFADEDPVLDLAAEDDLAPAAERVRDGPGVGDRHAPALSVAVDDAEAEPASVSLD